MCYEGEAGSLPASYSSYVRYMLTNDNTVTWADLTRGMLSSILGEYIPFSSVYTDLS